MEKFNYSDDNIIKHIFIENKSNDDLINSLESMNFNLVKEIIEALIIKFKYTELKNIILKNKNGEFEKIIEETIKKNMQMNKIKEFNINLLKIKAKPQNEIKSNIIFEKIFKILSNIQTEKLKVAYKILKLIFDSNFSNEESNCGIEFKSDLEKILNKKRKNRKDKIFNTKSFHKPINSIVNSLVDESDMKSIKTLGHSQNYLIQTLEKQYGIKSSYSIDNDKGLHDINLVLLPFPSQTSVPSNKINEQIKIKHEQNGYIPNKNILNYNEHYSGLELDNYNVVTSQFEDSRHIKIIKSSELDNSETSNFQMFNNFTSSINFKSNDIIELNKHSSKPRKNSKHYSHTNLPKLPQNSLNNFTSNSIPNGNKIALNQSQSNTSLIKIPTGENQLTTRKKLEEIAKIIDLKK